MNTITLTDEQVALLYVAIDTMIHEAAGVVSAAKDIPKPEAGEQFLLGALTGNPDAVATVEADRNRILINDLRDLEATVVAQTGIES